MSKWKLVPEEPTERMSEAALGEVGSGYTGYRVWKAMLAVAPFPPATAKDGMSERERKLVEAAREVLEKVSVRGDANTFHYMHELENSLAAYEGKETS